MANIRHFAYTVRLDSGLLIPAGAAAGRMLVSDAEGNATWKTKPRLHIVTWVLDGELTTGERNGPFIRIATGEEKKLIAVEASILEGTEAECIVKKNGTAVEGLTMKITKEAKEFVATGSPTLAAKDHLTMEVKAVTGAPKKLALSMFVESI